jgi:hypothetical protein
MTENHGAALARTISQAILPTSAIRELTNLRRFVEPSELGTLTPTGSFPTVEDRHAMWQKHFPLTAPMANSVPRGDRFVWMFGSWAHGAYLRTDNPTIDLCWDILWRMLQILNGALDRRQLLCLQDLVKLLPPDEEIPALHLVDPGRPIWLGGNVPVLRRIVQGCTQLSINQDGAISTLKAVTGILKMIKDIISTSWMAMTPKAHGVVLAPLTTIISTVSQSPAYKDLLVAATIEHLQTFPSDCIDDSYGTSLAMEFIPAFRWLLKQDNQAPIRPGTHLHSLFLSFRAISSAHTIPAKEPTVETILTPVPIRAAPPVPIRRKQSSTEITPSIPFPMTPTTEPTKTASPEPEVSSSPEIPKDEPPVLLTEVVPAI